MADATCKTCPFWERDPYNDRPGRGYCHHSLTAADDTNESARYEQFWCSEHPLRQRDRLAAMAMQGWIASYPEKQADFVSLAECRAAMVDLAAASYAAADAMLAEAAKAHEEKSNG